jgi:hypothetical protein
VDAYLRAGLVPEVALKWREVLTSSGGGALLDQRPQDFKALTDAQRRHAVELSKPPGAPARQAGVSASCHARVRESHAFRVRSS